LFGRLTAISGHLALRGALYTYGVAINSASVVVGNYIDPNFLQHGYIRLPPLGSAAVAGNWTRPLRAAAMRSGAETRFAAPHAPPPIPSPVCGEWDGNGDGGQFSAIPALRRPAK
jgi:hypothetical protein